MATASSGTWSTPTGQSECLLFYSYSPKSAMTGNRSVQQPFFYGIITDNRISN
jgi:hypothetical protein